MESTGTQEEELEGCPFCGRPPSYEKHGVWGNVVVCNPCRIAVIPEVWRFRMIDQKVIEAAMRPKVSGAVAWMVIAIGATLFTVLGMVIASHG